MSVRKLDLSKSRLTPKAYRVLSQAKVLAGVRALNLSRCTAGDKAVRVQIPGVIDQMIDTSGSVVQILKGNGNYYWSNLVH